MGGIATMPPPLKKSYHIMHQADNTIILNIENQISICYNAYRQKNRTGHGNKERTPKLYC